MTAAERQEVQQIVEKEGLLYAFQSYTDVREVNGDANLHLLVDNFLIAAEKLQKYIFPEDS